MRSRKSYDYIVYENEDFEKLQEYLQNETKFILDDMFNYADFFTNDNLKVIATDPPSMTVIIKAGVGYINKDLAYLLSDTPQVINAPSETSRTDIISVTAEEVDDDAQIKKFLDPVTKEYYTDDANMQHYLKYVIHYHPNTSEVPEGEVGLAKITVNAGATEILQADIEDIRPPKPSQDLIAHATSNPIDHANGSIFDITIANTAGIQLQKLDGHAVDNLLRWLYLNLAMPVNVTFTYNGDLITGYTAVGDYSHNATFTYNEDGYITKIERNDTVYKYTITFTYIGDKISGFDVSVVSL